MMLRTVRQWEDPNGQRKSYKGKEVLKCRLCFCSNSMYKGPFQEILGISDNRDHAMGMISDITVDLVALINNLYEYPEYLRVFSSQLFYNSLT